MVGLGNCDCTPVCGPLCHGIGGHQVLCQSETVLQRGIRIIGGCCGFQIKNTDRRGRRCVLGPIALHQVRIEPKDNRVVSSAAQQHWSCGDPIA